ncbi:hypothetical protein GCM10010129_83730 [Streptomyces fumigatiscleroticus]|nr:hypothetical protein GCM10010129_83730 [Streptomyces fumigatiscleroticus]
MSDLHGSSDTSQLAVVRTVVDGITVLSLQGEVDLYTAARLRPALAAGTAGSCPRLVVDFRGVSFMDSSGLNALLAAHRVMRDTPGWLRLAGLRPVVRRVVEITGVDAVIDCYATVGRALAS